MGNHNKDHYWDFVHLHHNEVVGDDEGVGMEW